MDKLIKKAIRDRTQLIDGIISAVEKRVDVAQKEILKSVITDLVEKMDRDGDQIKNTLHNKRLVTLIDKVFTDFAQGKGLEVAASVIGGVTQIMDFNGRYFGAFTKPAELAPLQLQVKESLSDWLGISKNGRVNPNGYLDTLVQDPNIKNMIKDITTKSVVGQSGFFETKENLKNFITGNEDTGALGSMQRYYRNFVYDTFSQVDRTNAKLYADKLKFNYAIYEGGLIKTSRKFCIDRNGKVFSREEIAAFDPPEAKPPGYNPFFDLGGYACRHHLNWIPDALAFALRPELRNMPAPTKEPPKDKNPEPKPQPAPPVKTAEDPRDIQPKNVPFDAAKTVKQKTFKPVDAAMVRDLDAINKTRIKSDAVVKEIDASYKLYEKLSNTYQRNAYKATETGREEMLAEVHKAYYQYTDKLKQRTEIESQTAEVKAKVNKTFKEILLKDKPKNNAKPLVRNTDLRRSPEFMAEVDTAMDFIRIASHGWVDDNFILPISKAKKRAFASNGEIFLTIKHKAKTIIHELGHVLDEHQQVFKNSVDFLESRTAGKPVLRLNTLNKKYRRDEIYKDGGFPNPYDGKIYRGVVLKDGKRWEGYRGQYATEIISRGLEYMYDSPADFYLKDPEYFNFIYSMFF